MMLPCDQLQLGIFLCLSSSDPKKRIMAPNVGLKNSFLANTFSISYIFAEKWLRIPSHTYVLAVAFHSRLALRVGSLSKTRDKLLFISLIKGRFNST